MPSLLDAAQQLTIYVGSIFFLTGLFGSIMIILVFSKDSQYRKTPCTFYFLVTAIHDLLLVLVLLGVRIVIVILSIDLTRMSVVWCKMRLYLFCTWAGILLTFQCLATLDQYLVTSKSARLRNFSTIKRAYQAVVINVIFWWLTNIPFLIYQDIMPPTGACGYSSEVFLRYVVYYSLFGVSWIHSLILIIFGILAYRNMIQTAALNQQNAHRQLTQMVCIQTIPVVVSGIFNGGWTIYTLATYGVVKNIDILLKEYLFNSVVSLLPYVVCSIRFYLFLIASSRFRQLTKKLLCMGQSSSRIGVSTTT